MKQENKELNLVYNNRVFSESTEFSVDADPLTNDCVNFSFYRGANTKYVSQELLPIIYTATC
jgi:hypothetical protein